VIDVTLTSKLTKDDKGLDKAEAKKRKEYIKNRQPAGDGFVAMALDCAGGWGPAMMKYFREASSEYGKRYIHEDEKDKQMRYIKEGISLAICKANGIYMRRIREGIPKDSEREKEKMTKLQIGMGSEGTDQ